ncbi:Sec-independent protein translocase subunit TatA [Nocardioides sp.]|uniref:Sec-independent protein translocase subunit TatA n=1 Tax=Nocardioides sp. TaxID=35761 RepID=UPI0027359DDA|nr:Sec-independent protein translocase subunit TatA [Nocardioides sp.]MDP3889684.1 Sec-independent protein translocase subunit TatA [Nocardioides sp.]
MITPFVLGPWEIAALLAVVVLLFGAAKLPDLARSTGRSLRIFKAETKGLLDDETPEEKKSPEQREIEARQVPPESDPITREHRDGSTS